VTIGCGLSHKTAKYAKAAKVEFTL